MTFDNSNDKNILDEIKSGAKEYLETSSFAQYTFHITSCDDCRNNFMQSISKIMSHIDELEKLR